MAGIAFVSFYACLFCFSSYCVLFILQLVWYVFVFRYTCNSHAYFCVGINALCAHASLGWSGGPLSVSDISVRNVLMASAEAKKSTALQFRDPLTSISRRRGRRRKAIKQTNYHSQRVGKDFLQSEAIHRFSREGHGLGQAASKML